MKVKLKLDANSIQQAMVDHAEKALFALVVLGFLFFVYKAVAREKPIKFDAAELDQKAKEAEKHVQATEATPPRMTDYKTRAEEFGKPIPNEPLLVNVVTPLDQPLWPNPRPRTKPVVFALKDLQGSPGSGAVAAVARSAADKSDADTRGLRWVIVTGLVDWRAQVEAYKTVFAETQPFELQSQPPEYAHYYVQRAEVNPLDDAPPPETSWKRISVVQMMQIDAGEGLLRPGGGNTTDPVPLLYQADRVARSKVSFVFPLPPLTNPSWGSEISHRGIPWQAGPMGAFGQGPLGPGGAADEPAPRPPGAPPTPDASAAAGEPRKAATVPTAKAHALPSEADEPDAPGAAGGVPAPGAGGRNPVTVPRKRPAPGRPGGRIPLSEYADSGVGLAEEPQYLLFRFFDFSVEPGKHYRYRVKLLLTNPNYELAPQYVERDDLRLQQFLEAEWSMASPAIRVPLDSRVLVAPAKPKEPAGTISLLVVHFDDKDGVEAFHEVTAPRGQWLEYLNQPFRAATGIGLGRPGTRPQLGDPALAGAAGGAKPPVNFQTEAILLDYAGGVVLPGNKKDLLEPRSILVADQAGNMTIRNELADESEYERFIPPGPTVKVPTGPEPKPKPGEKPKPPGAGGQKKNPTPGGLKSPNA